MKNFSFIKLLLLAGGIIGLGLLPMQAFAQDGGKVQDLQRVIDAQQEQLEAQQKQLDAQRQLLQELQAQIKSLAEDGVIEEVAVAAEKPPAMEQEGASREPGRERPGLSEADKYDRDSPSGSNTTYFDPSRTINIPGTKTSVGLHGLVEFQVIHDTVGLNNNRYDTITIPVDGGPSQTKFNVNPTQIHLTSATQVQNGQLNTMISMDFNGQLHTPEPRLRLAYGEYVNYDSGFGILGGQAYMTMLDLRAATETLDFAGPAGLWQLRTPLLRYTKSSENGMIFESSLESPESVIYTGASKLTRWPDFAVAGTWQPDGTYLKHLRIAGIVRDLRAESDADSSIDSDLGWAITGSGKLGLPFLGAKDNLKFTLHYGDGYGTCIKGGPTEGAFDNVNSKLSTIGIFGAYGGIQHFWSDLFRSNLVLGYVNADNPEFLDGDTFDNTNYAAANFIWTPYKSTTFGIEYLWGRRENKSGDSGTSNRFILSSKYNF